MLIFWKGTKMIENREIPEQYGCECCHCKKIFMMMVVLILVFIAGIMVGNCGRCRYADNYYAPQVAKNYKKMQHKKFHRGMHEVPSQADVNANQAYPDNQVGGFIIEVDQAN